MGKGQIDSADIGKEVVVAAGGKTPPVNPVGKAGAISEADGLGEGAGDPAVEAVAPNFCFLMASAWRLGGPRRRLGRSYVQGMSRLAHDRQGGPLVSHYSTQFPAISINPDQSIIQSLKSHLLTLTFRILQASHALRNLVLLLSMGETWMFPYFRT